MPTEISMLLTLVYYISTDLLLVASLLQAAVVKFVIVPSQSLLHVGNICSHSSMEAKHHWGWILLRWEIT